MEKGGKKFGREGIGMDLSNVKTRLSDKERAGENILRIEAGFVAELILPYRLAPDGTIYPGEDSKNRRR